ncbi:MAG TPA: hypothetical protein VH593_18025 [Ktedonobacteraceae bacterium]
MSEDTIQGCIKHHDISHVRLHKDYLDGYKGNEHKAKIVRIMETWTNKKRDAWYLAATGSKERGETIPEPDFWITLSFQQIRLFMFETASIDTIKANVAELVKDKHLQRRVNPEKPYGAPQYLLNCKVVQKMLDKNSKASSPVPELPDMGGGFSYPPGKPTPGMGGENTQVVGEENTPPGRGEDSPPSNNKTNNPSNNQDTSFVAASADDATQRLLEKIASLEAQLAAVQQNASTPNNCTEIEQPAYSQSDTGNNENAIVPGLQENCAFINQVDAASSLQAKSDTTQPSQEDETHKQGYASRDAAPSLCNDEKTIKQAEMQNERAALGHGGAGGTGDDHAGNSGGDDIPPHAGNGSQLPAMAGRSAHGCPADEEQDQQPVSEGEPQQVLLIDRPETPQMPPATMRWSAEKLVQITEAKRFYRGKQGAYFSDEKNGKVSQRERQLKAARSIISLGVSEEKYTAAYDDVNAWWSRGSLTVEIMLEKTPRHVIRVIETLEKLDAHGDRPASNNIRQFPTRPRVNNAMTRGHVTQEQQDEFTARAKDKDRVAKLLAAYEAEKEAERLQKVAVQ